MSTGGLVVIANQSVLSRMVALTSSSADVATAETTTSTSYTNLATSGPANTLTSGVTQNHLIHYNSAGFTTASGNVELRHSVAIAGATALDADSNQVNTGANNEATSGGHHALAAAQASGAVHTSKYKVASGTCGWRTRRQSAVAL